MRQIEKFLFNVSFDENELARAEAATKAAEAEVQEESFEEIELPTFSEEEVATARAEGFDAGKAEGSQETAESIEARTAETLAKLAGQFGNLFRDQTATNAALFDDAINIAVAILRKCFPYLTDTHAQQAIEDMVREVLAEILEEPRALVHVHPDLVEPLNARIAEIAEQSNFEGQVLIIDDAAMPPGDCRVSWSSGSAERDMKTLWQRVDEIVEQNVHALAQPERGAAGESAAPKSAPAGSTRSGAPTPVSAAPTPPIPGGAGATAQPEPGQPTGRAQRRRENTSDANTLSLESAGQANLGEGRDAGSGGSTTPEESDLTAAHLQAGPGIVEAAEDADILDTDQSEPSDSGQSSDDAAESSSPPVGNR
jgi:flagellar biosynthesis/type III secretory pathway protein FliH